jgi:hypothetical protein
MDGTGRLGTGIAAARRVRLGTPGPRPVRSWPVVARPVRAR